MPTQPLAQARDRDTALQRRTAEIPGAGNGHESIEIAEIEIAHCSI
jgi:hypothetical protein